MRPLPTRQNKSGLDFPVLGLGTWGMGGYQQKDPTHDDAQDIQAIHKALALGITHIDTAELYAQGHSEEIVALALEGTPRASVQLASKVMGAHHHHDDVLAACEHSLKRLHTDHLDLYYLHWHNPEIPLKETASALNKLYRDGRIKHIGVCNFHVTSMKELQAYLEAPIAVNQSHYSLVYREPERAGLLDYCHDNGITFVAWRPIMWHEEHRPCACGNAWERGKVRLLDEMADRYGKPNVQVALNWLINQPNVCALVKSSRLEHLKEILDSLTWTLSNEDRETLRRDFPNQQDVSSAVPLS
ncbi:MAG: aldo/keto reductase [Bdellovibrionales bacterium]